MKSMRGGDSYEEIHQAKSSKSASSRRIGTRKIRFASLREMDGLYRPSINLTRIFGR